MPSNTQESFSLLFVSSAKGGGMEIDMKVITTNLAKNQFWEETEAKQGPIGCMNLVAIFPEWERQTMKGFGGAFTESAGYCYSNLTDETKQELIAAYFGENGLNYCLGRSHINSCDFSLSNYAAVVDASDVDFKTFSLKREETYLLPLITDAREKRNGDLTFLLSPWSPPAFMKSNGEMNHGGNLKKEWYGTWARYICRYIKELQQRGLTISYLTVQNEPEAVQTWDSCVYHAKEEMEFARDYLYEELNRQGLSQIQIFVWDHNKEVVYSRAKEIFSDAKARERIAGVAVHWYTGDHFQGLSLVKEAFPEKEIFFTEGCVEYSRFADSGEVQKAEMYAHDMIGNFSHGVSAFLDWNLLLDSKGGPNHVGNFCAAPILCSEDWTQLEKRLSYYYIGQFSRYVKPGAKRIEVSTYCAEAETVAFVNPDGERVVILLNRSDQVLPVTLGENNIGTNIKLEPHSIMTICYL